MARLRMTRTWKPHIYLHKYPSGGAWWRSAYRNALTGEYRHADEVPFAERGDIDLKALMLYLAVMNAAQETRSHVKMEAKAMLETEPVTADVNDMVYAPAEGTTSVPTA